MHLGECLVVTGNNNNCYSGIIKANYSMLDLVLTQIHSPCYKTYIELKLKLSNKCLKLLVLCFWDNKLARRFKKIVASLPKPPKVEKKTSGVKDSPSTTRVRSPYSHFFSLKFVSTKKGSNLGLTIAWCVGMKNPNVRQCTFVTCPRSPLHGCQLVHYHYSYA